MAEKRAVAAGESDLYDTERLVRLFRLGLKAGDERCIAAVVPRLITRLHKLTDTQLILLLSPSSRRDVNELAAQAIKTVAFRKTISLPLAAAILPIAHASEDRHLVDLTEAALSRRLPNALQDQFRLQAASMRSGPQSAMRLARKHRKSGRTPSEAIVLGRMLISAGEGRLALRYLRRCTRNWPSNRNILGLLIRAHIMTGNPENAMALLDSANPQKDWPNFKSLRIAALLELGATTQVTELLLAENPSALSPILLKELIQLLIVEGNLSQVNRLKRIAANSAKNSPKQKEHFRSSFFGAMLNELEILERVRNDRTVSLSSKELAHVYFFEARRVLNDAELELSQGSNDSRSGDIPRNIWQYWNSPEVPDEISMAMGSWQAIPGWQYQKLTQRSAVEWLRKTFDEEHARAFKLANHVAEGADFLRLCLLLEKGGVYVDADDKRTGCLDDLISQVRGILLFREPYGSIANNFLCSAPGHPILARAVDMARNSLLQRANENTWSKTGPGLLTRITALHLLDNPDTSANDTLILPRYKLRRFVHPHLAVPYKSTSAYWEPRVGIISAAKRAALEHFLGI